MSLVLIEKNGRIGNIILNRPEKRNALNPEMVNALKSVISQLLNDDGVKVIVIRARGEVFCSGADLDYLKQLRNNSQEENEADSQNLREMFDLIYNSDKIFISQVEGAALAGGCGLATICDFSYASPDASFGYTESRIGFVPALVMVYLREKISGAKLRELLLTGKIISAQEAMDIGLINDIFIAGDLETVVKNLALNLCKTVSGSSIQLIKTMLREIPGKNIQDALDYAVKMNVQARSTDDCLRGVDAFLNKEKLRW